MSEQTSLDSAAALSFGPAELGRPVRPRSRRALPILVVLAVLGAGGALFALRPAGQAQAPAAAPPPPHVTVATPLQAMLAPESSFLGQFSAVDAVELRAQVGGTLTQINFTDGQIVHKGDLLFVIDPRPYEIRLAQAQADVQSAIARLALAGQELTRAQNLRRDDFGTVQAVDQRSADQRANQATLDRAQAAVRDAQLDLEYSRVTAPFTGRVSAHRVSVGSLVSGSRGGTTPTTLLTTLVSLDPIHLDFDMSEADYLAYQRAHHDAAAISSTVSVAVGDEGHFDRRGTLDFMDNAIDRGSGTIHARASLPNPDLLLTPGLFARLHVTMGVPRTALLVPDAAIMLDQSHSIVMTVAADGTVVPKPVVPGGLRQGLRVIESGLKPDDRIIVDGLMRARPGTRVTPDAGTVRLVADAE